MLGSSGSRLAIVSNAIAAAAEHLTDSSLLLLLAPLGPSAALVAPAVAAVVKVVIEEFGKQNADIEKKLDKVLAEPLAFARATLLDNLSVTATTESELQERQRQLTTAYDKFRQAEIYAGERDSEPIRFYRAVTAALMSGGRPYAELYIQQSEMASELARIEAKVALAEADEIDPEWWETHRRDDVRWAVDYEDYSNRNMAVNKNIDDAKEERLALKRKADELTEAANRLDRLCWWIECLARQTAEFHETLTRRLK